MSAELGTRQSPSLPVIDVGPLVRHNVAATASETVELAEQQAVGEMIAAACRDFGFFYVTGHGVAADVCESLESLSREFFALPLAEKMKIPMAAGGRAWRGYFAVGDELTSGRPDCKEGLYFGTELDADHPSVIARLPFHGPNLFPALPGFRETVLSYIAALTQLGHALMRGISLSLGLDADYFAQHFTRDPLVLFRIFNYPRQADAGDQPWGVGQHTDYGILTILRQDEVGGLQVLSRNQWIDAPPLPNSFVCNIGDMLDRMTGGRFRSTPHRVRNVGNRDRLSFPFFFDPSYHAQVNPIRRTGHIVEDASERWDGVSVHHWQGTYGDYLLGKVAKVFPELGRDAL